MPNIIPKIPIEKVNRWPLAYALMIVGGLLGVFSTLYFNKDREVINSYKTDNQNLRGQLAASYKKCDSVALFWQTRYLTQVEYTINAQRKADSAKHAARATLLQPNIEFNRVIKSKQK